MGRKYNSEKKKQFLLVYDGAKEKHLKTIIIVNGYFVKTRTEMFKTAAGVDHCGFMQFKCSNVSLQRVIILRFSMIEQFTIKRNAHNVFKDYLNIRFFGTLRTETCLCCVIWRIIYCCYTGKSALLSNEK